MDDASAVDWMLTENAQELVDSRTVLLKNQDTRFRLCQMLAQHTERWTWIVLREKAVYHTLNMFKADVSGMLRGEGWVISEAFEDVRASVNNAHSNMDHNMPSHVDQVAKPWPTPPTHFTTNKFTYGYQEFVNTYGIPRLERPTPHYLQRPHSHSCSVSCMVILDMDCSSSVLVCTYFGMKRRMIRPSWTR